MSEVVTAGAERMERHAEEVRNRIAKTVMRAARAAQQRVFHARKMGWPGKEGQTVTLSHASTETVLAEAEAQLLDTLIFAAVARDEIRNLRSALADQGAWARRVVAAKPHMRRTPKVGQRIQYVGMARYVDIERVSSYVFELRMGEVGPDGEFSSPVRRRVQGWVQCGPVIVEWMSGGAVER